MAKHFIGRQDFTDLFHKYGYEVGLRVPGEGENGGLMCSGEEQRDLLAACSPPANRSGITAR